LICEQLGDEPDPQKMPVSPSVFPAEVQTAFFVLGFLEDNWDGSSGSYLGKNWNNLEYLFNLYEVEDPKNVLFFMKIYEGCLVTYRADKSENKRKAEERKSKASSGGGKQYAHNVKL
tara:strand:+ start:4193 stop:4543 length:351 start_codon:yes stop_codon:yes gene_type:complete